MHESIEELKKIKKKNFIGKGNYDNHVEMLLMIRKIQSS